MKTTSVLFSMAIFFSQVFCANASADLTCEKKHKAAIAEVANLIRKNPNREFANLMLNGKNSGIDLYDLSDAQMKSFTKSVEGVAMDLQRIMNKPRCTLAKNKKLEMFKKAIKPTDMPEAQFVIDVSVTALNNLIKSITPFSIPDNPANFENGIRVLNTLGGLQGINNELEKAITAQEAAPADSATDTNNEEVMEIEQ